MKTQTFLLKTIKPLQMALLLLITSSIIAQVPQSFKYQAVLRDETGQLMKDKALTMRVSIYEASVVRYQETHSVITNEYGLVNIEVGMGIPVSGSIAAIDWSAGDFFLQTEINAGAGYVNLGRSQLLSVPYALHAKTADEIKGGITETDPVFSSSPASGITSGNISNWNAAHSWGNHAVEGYLKTFTENDPTWSGAATVSSAIGRTGNVGIGITTPNALLHLFGTGAGGGNLLCAGSQKASPGDPPASGAGTRMMWYPDKAAFRAGHITGDQWDKSNVGNYSIAMGYSTIASGNYSTCIGDRNWASGDYATALGSKNNASGSYSTALGSNSFASGNYSTAIGDGTNATGARSTALGDKTTASGNASVAMGFTTISSGNVSTAMGGNTIAPSAYETVIGRWNTEYAGNPTSWVSGNRLFVIGNGTSSDTRSNAMTVLKNGRTGIGTDSPGAGLHLKGSSFPESFMFIESNNGQDAGIRLYEGAIQKWHIYNHSSEQGLSIRNTAFAIAIFASQSNAFVGINTSSPSQRLDVNGNARIRSIGSGAYQGPVNRMSDGTLTTATSDFRLKENIETIQSGIEKVKQIRGVTFNWKSNPEYGSKIGFIAQEIEVILPELVFTNEADGYKGVNYPEMTAVLVEAIKEQQAEIDQLKKILDQQQAQISVLFQLAETALSEK